MSFENAAGVPKNADCLKGERQMSGYILIRGLSHSGTTVLDLALGAHRDIVGLGEAARTLIESETAKRMHSTKLTGPQKVRAGKSDLMQCTCGTTASSCAVWGETIKWLLANDDEPIDVKWSFLTQRVTGAFEPPPRWIVDSSQNDERLLPVLVSRGADVRVVFLARDIRSWVYSRLSKEKNFSTWAIMAIAREWKKQIAGKLETISKLGVPCFTLGYEELALQPQLSLTALSSWLGIDFDESMLTPARSKSHIIVGNRVRRSSERLARFNYDGSWLASHDSFKTGLLTLPYLGANRRWVYSNELLVRR